ncbi:MAG: response regulator [Proteobacteria bacterium]|nr:response regulator [Pseudomonadota bacterium]MBU1453835.1 response regulator [Pseudomonadota bacterium]
MNIRTKSILFVLLIITLLSTVYLTLSISHQRQDLNNKILAKEKSALFLAENLQEQAFAHYRTRIVSLATSKEKVIEAFARRDRDNLQKAATGFYTILQKENPHFRNMQFNLPDGTTFLRMHLPDFHGDDLTTVRPILNHVHKMQKQATGYEIGRSGLFFRVVQPMFYQSEYIGSIGFGIRPDHLLELLRKEISPHVALATSTSNWNKVTRSQTPVIEHGEDVILSLGSELFSDFPLSSSTSNKERIHFKGRNFVLFSNISLNDFQDQPIARILVALDITDDLKDRNHFITQIILLTLGLLALTALVLHFSFGQLLDTIINLNKSLAQANEELEERVHERTAELAESNLALKKEIEERQRIENDLRQAEKMQAIGTLASGIAHDFNNILTAILGYTYLALVKLTPGQEIALHLDEVQKAGMRAKDLVAQILSFSRHSEHKKQVLKLQPILCETLKLLRASIPANINIIKNIREDCCPALVDSSQMHQVLMNLCTNAYHAMADKGGTLTINLSQIELTEKNAILELVPGPYLKLEVGDTGSGMEASTLARIFEPYFTTKATGKGTGLGLAVVHGIIKSFNGHIMAESSPGQGSTFTMLLPCHQGEESHEEPAPDNTVIRGKGEHLLVVDDEKEIILFWKILLEEMGYQVTSIADSTAAYQWLSKHITEIDGVITDMSMPKMTGLELSRKIKDFAPSMPIALCSGFTSPELQEKAQALGVKTFIKKPVDNVLLSQTLRILLS